MHSESWWPRLFTGGPEIAWDDYEKDYSDLPAPVMAEHARLEAEKEAQRQLEADEVASLEHYDVRYPHLPCCHCSEASAIYQRCFSRFAAGS